MANTFYAGGGKGLEYWSVHFTSSASGERGSTVGLEASHKIACLEILTVLLATQPNIVRIPEKAVLVEPNQLRAEGRCAPTSLEWPSPAGGQPGKGSR